MLTDIKQLLPTNIYQGLTAANAPSAGNPFATIADIVTGPTIYTGDDSLTGTRTVSLAGFDLYFNGIGDVGIGTVTPASAKLAVYKAVPFGNLLNTFIVEQNYTFVGLQTMTFGNNGRFCVGVNGAGIADSFGHQFWAPYTATQAFSINTNTGNSLFSLQVNGDFGLGALAGPLSNFSLVGNAFSMSSSLSDISLAVNILSPSATIHAKGSTSDATASVLRTEDSVGTLLLTVRNDGLIAMPGLQTGNAGLATGDLYVDTAANISANGDNFVGWKV